MTTSCFFPLVFIAYCSVPTVIMLDTHFTVTSPTCLFIVAWTESGINTEPDKESDTATLDRMCLITSLDHCAAPFATFSSGSLSTHLCGGQGVLLCTSYNQWKKDLTALRGGAQFESPSWHTGTSLRPTLHGQM